MLVDPSSSCSCSSSLLWKSATDTAVSLWDFIDVTVRLSGSERGCADKVFLVIFVLRFYCRCWAWVQRFYCAAHHSTQNFSLLRTALETCQPLCFCEFTALSWLFTSGRRGLTRAFILWSQYQIALVFVKVVLFTASSRWPDFVDYCSYSFVCFGSPRFRTHPSPTECPYRHSSSVLVAMTADSACQRSSIM